MRLSGQQCAGTTPDTHQHVPRDICQLTCLLSDVHVASPHRTAHRRMESKLLASFSSDHVCHVCGSRQLPSAHLLLPKWFVPVSNRTLVSGELGTQCKHCSVKAFAKPLGYFFLRKNTGKLVKMFTLILSLYPGLACYFPAG